MSFLTLGPKTSDWFVVVYLFITLGIRFVLEPQIEGHYLISMGLGLFALLFLWALIKSKFLQPTYFGLLDKKEN